MNFDLIHFSIPNSFNQPPIPSRPRRPAPLIDPNLALGKSNNDLTEVVSVAPELVEEMELKVVGLEVQNLLLEAEKEDLKLALRFAQSSGSFNGDDSFYADIAQEQAPSKSVSTNESPANDVIEGYETRMQTYLEEKEVYKAEIERLNGELALFRNTVDEKEMDLLSLVANTDLISDEYVTNCLKQSLDQLERSRRREEELRKEMETMRNQLQLIMITNENKRHLSHPVEGNEDDEIAVKLRGEENTIREKELENTIKEIRERHCRTVATLKSALEVALSALNMGKIQSETMKLQSDVQAWERGSNGH